MGKKKKKSGKKKIEEKKIEEKKIEEKKIEEKKDKEKKDKEKKVGEKKAPEEEKKKTSAEKKASELSEAEKRQREKNRQKALKESRSKKSAKAKAKFQKQKEKAAKQKAVKRVRKHEAKKEQVRKFFRRITSVSIPDSAKKNLLIGAFIIAVIMVNIAVFMTVDFGKNRSEEEESVASGEEFLLSEENDTQSENTVSADEEKEEPKEEEKESSSFNAAKSKEKNLQDVFPHEGGLYFMPLSNDAESVTGALLGTCILKKEEYDELEEGEVLDFANDKYMILSISRGGDFGTAMSMTAFDENEDYERVFREEKSYEDYFGMEKIVYGMTIALEEEQIKQMGSPDYFADDGYAEDDMIFFAGMSLYFPLTYTMDENVTLYFDDDCVLTVPDDTFIGDEEYDVGDYLAGKHPMYPPDLMAAKVETEGNRITKYNVMFAGMENIE